MFGSPNCRLFSIWCASSYSALRPRCGAAPAWLALPVTFISTMAMLLVASRTMSLPSAAALPPPSNENTASYSLPSWVSNAPEPGGADFFVAVDQHAQLGKLGEAGA